MGYESLLLLGIAALFGLLYLFQSLGEDQTFKMAYIVKAVYFISMLGFGFGAIVLNYNPSQTVCTYSSPAWTCAYSYSNGLTGTTLLITPYFVIFMVLIMLQFLYLWLEYMEAIHRVANYAYTGRGPKSPRPNI